MKGSAVAYFGICLEELSSRMQAFVVEDVEWIRLGMETSGWPL
jgi:hypothetical protein